MDYTLENVTIDRIYKSTENKDGKKFVSSKGNPFTKVDIYVDARSISDGEFEGKMSYFDYYGNSDSWDIGSTISGKVVKNGKYFNFELERKTISSADMKDVLMRLARLEGAVFKDNEVDDAMKFSGAVIEPKKEEKKEEDISEDLPF